MWILISLVIVELIIFDFVLLVCIEIRRMSVNGRQIGHQYCIGYLNDIKEPHVDDPHLMGCICAILLPTIERNSVLHITSSMLQILKLKGLFSGLENEDAYEHLRNFGDICGPFSFKIISQKFIQERLF